MGRVLVAMVLAFSLLVVGCTQSSSKPADSVTITGNNGEKLSVNTNIPDELKDFPVPSGFKTDSGGTMSSNGSSFSAIAWKGQGNLKDVIEFYKTTMPTKGWTSDGMEMETADSGLFSYKKGDFGVTLTVSMENSAITIAVIGGKGGPTPPPANVKSTSGDTSDDSLPEPTATKSSAKPEATSTPAAPATTSSSALPEELKDFPAPSGFSVIKGSTSRMASNGKLSLAVAKWFGQGDVDAIAKFYTEQAAAKGWNEQLNMSSEEGVNITYSLTKDAGTYYLMIVIEKTDAGIEVGASMGPSS